MVKKLTCLGVLFLFCSGICSAARRPVQRSRVFYGDISDSTCGLRRGHEMGGTARSCTLICVRMGAKFVLADQAHNKVYALSDQTKARPFAGDKVKVTGTLKGNTIEVASIKAVK